MPKKKSPKRGRQNQAAYCPQPVPASNISAGFDRALTHHRDSGSPAAGKS
jgi:hypothetical protein